MMYKNVLPEARKVLVKTTVDAERSISEDQIWIQFEVQALFELESKFLKFGIQSESIERSQRIDSNRVPTWCYQVTSDVKKWWTFTL